MPRISSDPLKAFVALRNSLESKRTALISEIAEIDAALGSMGVAAPGKAKAPVATAGTRGTKRAKNELSLKDAVIKAIGNTPLTKEAILAGVQKLGYQFAAKNPTNSLNTLLYGKKPKFKNADGKFSLA